MRDKNTKSNKKGDKIMGHIKRILVFLLSTLVFMTGGTVVVAVEMDKRWAELE